MAFAGINPLAILIAAAAGFAFGAAYYIGLSKQWLAAVGMTEEGVAAKRSPAPFIVSMMALLIMAWVLAGGIGHLGPGQVTLKNGVIGTVHVAGLRHHHPGGQLLVRPAQADAHGNRWHPLAGRARYTGRHHRRDGRMNEA
jgi:hypothetical protein